MTAWQHENDQKINSALISKCYVINLKNKPERWKRMQEELSCIGITVERVDAVDGKEMLKGQKPPFSVGMFRRLTPGEYGCRESHRLVWRRIANGDADFCLILEDDILLSPRFNQFIREFRADPKKIDIVHIEKTGKGTEFFTERRGEENGTTFEVNGIKVTSIISPLMYAGALIISREGAKKIVGLTNDVLMPTDEMLFSKYSPLFGKLNVYQTESILAWQLTDVDFNVAEEYSSSINPERKEIKRLEPKIYRPIRASRKFVKNIQYMISMAAKNKISITQDESDLRFVQKGADEK